MSLNKDIREHIQENNYVVFKQFIKYINLNSSKPKKYFNSLINQTNATILISTIMKEVWGDSRPGDLMPFAFETDGGTYNDSH